MEINMCVCVYICMCSHEIPVAIEIYGRNFLASTRIRDVIASYIQNARRMNKFSRIILDSQTGLGLNLKRMIIENWFIHMTLLLVGTSNRMRF